MVHPEKVMGALYGYAMAKPASLEAAHDTGISLAG